ncbi:hypothetical protein [Alteromonas sp. a30]|uniref:hypothetical protein n=1 Tax=Alteromonas sp. a30 TaxID=2730917 RepID=UPI002280C3ED|nr:hypothetical protein [Alteromonas sp. a30]MCY7296967.1 hypothetical protein [Alteromonas sp. a30]
MFAIIIILIVALIVLAIMVNAFQQHKEKVEAEKRTELSKQKAIIDETENVIMSASQSQIPISPMLNLILLKRIQGALKLTHELNPKTPEIKQRLNDIAERIKMNEADAEKNKAAAADGISLPDNDKQIIVTIQSLKKLRALLRTEHSKGKVSAQVFIGEDKRLDKMQLRVNVDTLARRADSAIQSQMMGSARQYLEKAIVALTNFSTQDEYVTSRRAQLEQQLSQIQENLRNSNAEDTARRIEDERNELDELFAPKKKW